MSVGRFSCGIAALIYDPASARYLLLKRASHRDAGAGDWECVTGRVDQGESFEEALRREVREELQANVSIDYLIGTSHFYRGEAIPENELLAVRYLCSIDDPSGIVVSDEHSQHVWMTAGEAIDFLPPGHWLRATIQRAELVRSLVPEALIELHRKEGFEL